MTFFNENQNGVNDMWPTAHFEGAPIIWLKLDVSGIIIEATGAGLAMLCLPAREIIGRPITEAFEFQEGKLQFRELLIGKSVSHRASLNGRHLDIFIDFGAATDCSYALIIIEGEQGIRDRVYQELKESEERHRAIWDNSPVGICLTDRDGNYRFVNPAYCQIYGFKPDELIGRKFYDLIAPVELRPRALNNHRELFKKNKTVPMGQAEFLRRDGERIWIQYAADFVRRNGEPLYLVSMNSDITERRRIEAALELSEKRYQELFDSVMEGLGLVDENEIVQYCNPAFAGIFGENSVQHMVGKNILDYVGEDEKVFVLNETAQRKKGNCSKYELNIINARHAARTIWVSVSPRFDSTGKYKGAFGAIMDITERKQSEIRGRARLKLLEDLRYIDDIDQCLACGCQAIFRSRLYRRAVITLHDENRRITNLGYIGLDKAVIEAARNAPPPDKALSDKMMDQRFRLGHSYFIPADEGNDLYQTSRYIPQTDQSPAPDLAWQVGDEFFSSILGSDGRCEGWLSVDTPFSGRRPTLNDAVCLEELLNIVAKKVNELRGLELLRQERQSLEQKNIALSEVFDRIEEEKQAIKQQFIKDIDHKLKPAYEKLLNQDGTLNRAAHNMLGIGLQAASTSSTGILDLYSNLSPREIEICELLKRGKKSQDIARMLIISKATVQKHREMIRRKLGIKNQKVNLISYLKAHGTP